MSSTRGKSFTPEQDEAICRAYLSVTEDPIVAESVKWQDINPGKKLKTHEAPEFDDIMESPVFLKDNQVPSSFDSVDRETTSGSGSVSSPRKRPAGTKLAKRDKLKNKIHEVDNARHINLLETLNKTMADNSTRRIEMEEIKVASLERETVCEEKETERKDREMEERIMVIAVNGKFSGPTFNVTTNENVIVNVRNKLNENALVTWPGVQMRRISWQDGVLGTNCPIRPGWNWTYEFQVKDQIGSFFYFPSLNFQRASGGFGSFIITNRKVIPLPFNMPDGDIVILIGDWYTKSHSALRTSLDSGKDLGMPDGVLINGKGPYQYNASVPNGIDYETINVDQESEVLDNWALGHFTSTDCVGDLYIHTGALPDPPNDAYDTSYAVNQAMSIRLWLLEYCATDEALSGMHPGQVYI
ncbi:hypothetical protein AgCh_036111 [Apium graveolens]